MAGIKVLPSIINAAIITSAWSAGNTYMYVATRTLRGLALNGGAPRILAKTSKYGVPYWAVIATIPIGLLGYLSAYCSQAELMTGVGKGGAAQAFNWLQAIIALNVLLNWGMLLWLVQSSSRYSLLYIHQIPRSDEGAGARPQRSPLAWQVPTLHGVVCSRFLLDRLHFQGIPSLLEGSMEHVRLYCKLHQ